jgi:hypothetical protein
VVGQGRGRAWHDRGGAAGARRGEAGAGEAVRGGLGADDGVATMQERETEERKGRAGYYTHLCSPGRHISRRT